MRGAQRATVGRSHDGAAGVAGASKTPPRHVARQRGSLPCAHPPATVPAGERAHLWKSPAWIGSQLLSRPGRTKRDPMKVHAKYHRERGQRP